MNGPTGYQGYAAATQGAQQSPGAVPTPLYGLDALGSIHPAMGLAAAYGPAAVQLGQSAWERVRQPLPMFTLGAATVGALWIYFGLYRPLKKKTSS